ncbi:hypothetical protein ScPMuIL_011005 [Solemya velum]
MPLPKIPLPSVSIPSLSVLSLSSLQLPANRKLRFTIFGVTLGVTLIGFVAFFFRRIQRSRYQQRKNNTTKSRQKKQPTSLGPTTSTNGEIPNRSVRSLSPSSVLSMIRKKSLSGSQTSLGGVSSASTITHSAVDTTNMSPSHLCQMGLEYLQTAVSHWEDALMKLSYVNDSPVPALQDPVNTELHHRLEHLLESAYRLQDGYEREWERHFDQMALGSAITALTELDRAYEGRRSYDADSCSDQESFVSATDMADLSDLETHRELFQHLSLYEAGLLELKHGSVPCRTLRSELVGCLSDTEYLAKLHVIRLSMELMFGDSKTRSYFTDLGRQIMGDLLVKSNRDPDEFYTAFDDMLIYLEKPDTIQKMEEELRGRGVKMITFFDVCLDFIMMDAFDDLEFPPTSVTAVTQNRWLSNGFKETALSTAVWSVLKAKRRMLKYSDGFIAHFYTISEHISPVLAWGFLGPDSPLKELCYHFKDSVVGFLQDIFSFEKARYTTVEDLAADILHLAKERFEDLAGRVSS